MLIREGRGMKKQRRSSQEAIVQAWGRVLVPPQGIYITIPLSSSAGTKVPTQEEDGSFRLSTRFLEHHPVASPPTNQKTVCTQWKIMKGASLVVQ